MFYMFGFSLPEDMQIDSQDVFKLLQKKEDVVIIDVRTAHEYSRGSIDGSINIPVDEVKKKIGKTVPDKNKKIIVYCLSGSRSVVAAVELSKLGYKNVFNMTSGLLSWRSNGFPLS